MRIIKSFFISLTLLLFCSGGILAADGQPSYYVSNATTGEIKEIPVSTMNAIPTSGGSSIEIKPEAAGTTEGSWYWCGTTGSDATTVNNIKFTATGATSQNKLIANLVVGTNGSPGNPALTITNNTSDGNGNGTWSIPENVTLNIYAAAPSATETADYDTCFLRVINSNSTAAPAITVSGGTLNVVSGGLEALCNKDQSTSPEPPATITPGLSITSGQVNVNGGELEGNINTGTAYNGSANAINITGGTLTVNGGRLDSMQYYTAPAGTRTSSYSPAGIGLPATTTPNTLVVSNGTVVSNIPVTDATGSIAFNQGLWVQRNQSNSNIAGTVKGNATLATGIYDGIYFDTKDSTLTVPTGSSLTLPAAPPTIQSGSNAVCLLFSNGAIMNIEGTVTVNSSFGLWFDSVPSDSGGQEANGTGGSILSVVSGANLIINDPGNVTLGVGTTNPSQLKNSGTITVNPAAE